MTIFLLVLYFNSGKQIAKDGWLGFGKALSGNDPTGFGLYPTSIPQGVIVQKCPTATGHITRIPGATTFPFGPPRKKFRGSPRFLAISGQSPIAIISTLDIGPEKRPFSHIAEKWILPKNIFKKKAVNVFFWAEKFGFQPKIWSFANGPRILSISR